MRTSEREFTWRAHPAREQVGHAVLGGAIIVAVALVVAGTVRADGSSLTTAGAWGLLSVLVLVLALNRFFFPSRFVIDGDGITARYPLRRLRLRWEQLRRFAYDQRSGYLSTRSGRSRMDAFRGMFVLFGRDREMVIRQIRARLSEGAGA